MDLLTTAEVAELLRTSPSTVRYWRHVGKGPASVKVGRRVLHERSDVEQWLRGLREPRSGTVPACPGKRNAGDEASPGYCADPAAVLRARSDHRSDDLDGAGLESRGMLTDYTDAANGAARDITT